MNRINRVTSILIQLQSKKIIPAKEIAQRFNISLRTVYRDIRTLEEAGIPIGSEAGKGYFLVEGFLLPPVMFTAAEVGALITAGKFLNCHGDESFIKDFDSAMYKIKSILKHGEKNYAQELENSINVYSTSGQKNTLADNVIAAIQTAICNKRVISIQYPASGGQEPESRMIEPISLGFYEQNWYLNCPRCRLKQAVRQFLPGFVLILVEQFCRFAHDDDAGGSVELFRRRKIGRGFFQFVSRLLHQFQTMGERGFRAFVVTAAKPCLFPKSDFQTTCF